MRLLVLCALAGCGNARDPAPAPAASPPSGDPWAKAPAPPADASVAADLAALPPEPDLAGELELIRTKLELPALAAAVWRDGKRVEAAVVGVRKTGDATKATLQDQWHLGSNGKAMTALLIGIYVDRGVIGWSDTLGQVFRDLTIDPGYKDVSLDQLLRHEGGAPRDPSVALTLQLAAAGTDEDARSSFVRAILATPPAQAPGTYVYSNAGYMIAGAMLEAKTGKRWEQLIRDELFAKLDMTSCGFGAPGSPGAIEQPWGHRERGKPVEPGPHGDNPPGLGPAGIVHCSLDDYGKFLNMVVSGVPALVTAKTALHLRTPSTGGKYAGGWSVKQRAAGVMLFHSGSNTMWFATAVLDLSKKLVFVVVTNKGTSLEPAVQRLLPRFDH